MASPPSQQASCALTGFVSLLEIARAKARAPPDFSTNATKPPMTAIRTMVWALLPLVISTNR